MRFLIVGGDSTLGVGLRKQLEIGGHEVVVTSRRPGASFPLDLSKDISSWTLPGMFDAAFLFASVCSWEMVEKNPEASRKINVDNTVLLAEKILECGSRVVFPSTNQVFDGTLAFPTIDTPVTPVSEYGRQKSEAERKLLALGKGVAVVRFTKILSPSFPLFKKWRTALSCEEVIKPFSDLYFSPVSLKFSLEASIRIAEYGGDGIWHVSGKEDISYAEAARIIAQDMQVRASLVRPMTITESGLDIPAAPSHTALDVSRLVNEIGMTPPLVNAVLLGG